MTKGRPDLRVIDPNAGVFADLDAIKAQLPEAAPDDATDQKKCQDGHTVGPPRKRKGAVSLYLWASKILLGIEDEDDDHPRLTYKIPMIPCELDDAVQRLHCGGVFNQLWRQTFMALSRTPPAGRMFPVVYVPSNCVLPSRTIRAQLDRLAKAGLIEIVERRPGVSIRVRFKQPPPEMLAPDEWTKITEDEDN